MADVLPDGFIWTPFSPDLDQPFSMPGIPSKAIADLLPYGFIWAPFCPDQDQAIFEPGHTLPNLLQICFYMASFGYLSV